MRWWREKAGIGSLVLAVFFGFAMTARADMLAYEINFDGSATLWDLSPVTGLSNPRTTVSGFVGIEFGIGGTLFGLTSATASAPNSLYSIDPITGAAVLIGATGFGSILEGDLAFDFATNTLYGLYQLATPNLNLFSLNMTTGSGTIVGGFSADFRDPSGMAFDGAGNLVVLNTQSGFQSLLTIDKATGAVLSDIGITDGGNPAQLTGSAGMDFDPVSNTMYLTDSGTKVLYSLNTTNGQLTFLLNGSSLLAGSAAGLAVIPNGVTTTPVPEPSTIVLLAAGLAGIGLARRRKA